MRPLPPLALALAGLTVAAGCSFADGRADVPPPSAPLKGSFESASPAVAERATRFDMADGAMVRADRGVKHDAGS